LTVDSLKFLSLLLVASAFFSLIPSVRLRRIVLALWSAGFLWTLIPNVRSWMALAAFLLSGYGVAQLLRRWPNAVLLWSYLVALLAVFIVLKKYSFLGYFLPAAVLSLPIGIVGLSYMLFRQIHVIVDSMQGQLDQLTLWDYCNYQANLFTVSAGPIQRFQDFHQSWGVLKPVPVGLYEISKTWLRILAGVIKIAGVGTAILFAYTKSYARLIGIGSGHPSLAVVLPWFAAVFYLYPLYIFANFSGYCDIVIGGAALVGISLPENFDKPYLSRNVIDFWTRFHRTLGFWIRDYLFMPLYKTVAERKPRNAQSCAFACYFVAFFLAGVWHGSTSNFAVYGLIHGSGASATKLWETYLIRTRGRAYLKEYLQIRWVKMVAIAGTLHFYAFSILFFPARLDKCLAPILILVRSLGLKR
jgi:alginate O-acetyltransferase complex protein AlgI